MQYSGVYLTIWFCALSQSTFSCPIFATNLGSYSPMFPLLWWLQIEQALWIFHRFRRTAEAAPTLRKCDPCHCPSQVAGRLHEMHPSAESRTLAILFATVWQSLSQSLGDFNASFLARSSRLPWARTALADFFAHEIPHTFCMLLKGMKDLPHTAQSLGLNDGASITATTTTRTPARRRCSRSQDTNRPSPSQ